jgi:hypothetical protein
VNKVLLSLLFFLLVQPAYAKWVLISKDGQGNSYFYEDTKVVLNPGAEQVSAWQMISYEERMSAPNGESIYSVIQDISYFCRPGYESYKQFYIGYYAGSGGSGTSLGAENTPNSPWERVIPDTMSDVLFQFFCKPRPPSKGQSSK